MRANTNREQYAGYKEFHCLRNKMKYYHIYNLEMHDSTKKEILTKTGLQ